MEKRKKNLEKGAIYVAVGDKFINECIFSANSLKKRMPEIPVTLFTDSNKVKAGRSINQIIKIIPNKNPHKIKIDAIINSPYYNTLFIDTDTKILKPLHELFEFLHIYDLGIAPRIKCDYSNPNNTKFIDYIDFGHYNTGVIVYKKSKPTMSFFYRWKELASLHDNYDMRSGHFGDQHFFNKLIFEEKFHKVCDMDYFLMPNTTYNARLWLWQQAKHDNIYKNIKILHAHGLDEKPLKTLIKKFKHKFFGKY